MKQIVLILCFAFLQGCAIFVPSDDWTRADTIAEISWQVMNAVDYRQTVDLQNHPNLKEGNWLSESIIGEHPDSASVAQLSITYGISHYLISKYLPKKLRSYWHGGTIGTKLYVIKNNHNIGTRIQNHSHPLISPLLPDLEDVKCQKSGDC